ncbi:secreted protein [Melampsora americana]|nr:secreted protein [Melampsora americana]
MSARLFISLLAIFSVVSLAHTQVDKPTSPTKCTQYNNVNTTKALCNDIFTCPGKCTGAVVAKSCRVIRPDTDFLGNPNAGAPPNPVIDQVNCTKLFGRNTAQAKACSNETAEFSCSGGIVPNTYALCYDCAQSSGEASSPSGNPNATTTPNTTTTTPGTPQNGSMTPDTACPNPPTSNTTSSGNATSGGSTTSGGNTNSAGITQRLDMQQGLVLVSLSLFMLSV